MLYYFMNNNVVRREVNMLKAKNFHNVTEHPELGIYVIQCGFTACHPLHRPGPIRYLNYVLHFGLKGRCKYFSGGAEYDLAHGDGFVILPGQRVDYVADEHDPCQFIYVIFNGAAAPELMRRLKLDESNVFFRFDTDKNFTDLLYKLHSSCKNVDCGGYDANANLLMVLAQLMRQSESRKIQRAASDYLKKAVDYIEYHYQYKFTNVDLAAHVGLERSYLYRLFKGEYGMSPSEFIVDYRLQKAAELLERDDLTLNEIAHSTGFCDFSNLSKNFTRRYGLSPGEYRKLRLSGGTP